MADFDIFDEIPTFEDNRNSLLDDVFDFISKIKTFDDEEKIKKIVHYIEQLNFFHVEEDEQIIQILEDNKKQVIETIKQAQILQQKTSASEVKEVGKMASALQFKYETSLWQKLFSQRSCYNELYGQALFHVTLGVISDLYIHAKDMPFVARPNLFYIQRPRSGKNRGMYFVEDILRCLKKNDKQIIVRQGNKQTDPTLLDRPAMEVLKGGVMRVKKDETGTVVIIPGVLSSTNLYWYPEANSLLNPTSKDNMEAVNIHLNLLESNGKYEKQLVQWQGLNVTTYGGNYALVALTRPIHNIKQHILFSGLLPRCIFIPRLLTKEDRKKMRTDTVLYMHRTEKDRQEYQKDFDKLILELQDIQQFVANNKIVIRDEDSEKIRGDVHRKLELLSEYIEQQFLSEQNVELIEDFIGNYTDHMSILAYQTAAIRKSQFVEIVDYEYAFNFLKQCLDQFIPWLEETVEQEKKEIEKVIVRSNKIRKFVEINKGLSIKMPSAVKEICMMMKCSHMTARKIIFRYSESPYNYYKINIEDKVIQF